jgi:hypothetical protein
MDEELDIIVTGFDVDPRQAESGLMNVFGLDAVRARRFVRDLPVVAKRCGNRASADRYVQALRSIGARVEAQPAADGDGHHAVRAAVSSLPIPAPSVMARLHESLQVERETVRAIRRFRAAEGLEPDDDHPLPLDLDPTNPDIPRAPKVPHDLDKMPNAKLPRVSDRPEWMLTDPLAQGEGSGADGARTSRPHADARLPPPPSTAPRARAAGGSGAPSGTQPTPEARGRKESVRPSAVGLAHAATASVRPGIGLLSWWQRLDNDTLRRKRLREYWPAAVAVALVGAAALWFSGALETEAGRRERAWRAQGIDPGDYADAAVWLDAPDHELGGLAKADSRELVEGLNRAGARSVYAVWIRKQGQGARAAGLVIELPPQAAERRTILWHVARARGRSELEPDDGGRYYLLTFE